MKTRNESFAAIAHPWRNIEVVLNRSHLDRAYFTASSRRLYRSNTLARTGSDLLKSNLMLEALAFCFMISFLLLEFAVVSNSPRHCSTARGLTNASRVKKNGAELGD